jgi:hypothetical protein
MPYDIKTVPEFVIKVGSYGPIDIIHDSNAFVLYNNGDQWMVFNKGNHAEIKEMYSSYDIAQGDVLVSGLGFGILALWLCGKPEVTSVTVVEFSEDVIKLFKESNDVPNKLKIINDNIITYETDKMYDTILLDHYEKQNFDWRLKDMSNILNRISHKLFWAWSLEQIYLLKMYGIDAKEIINKKDEDTVFQKFPDLSQFWNIFTDNYFLDEKQLKNISNEKINEYMYTYFSRDHLLK